MQRITEVDRPGLAVRAFYKIGERMFGAVPTPERIMAHRVPLMLGIGGLLGLDGMVRHPRQALARPGATARRQAVRKRLLSGHPSRRRREGRHSRDEARGARRVRDVARVLGARAAALGFATAIVRDDREVTDEDWARLRQHFSEPEVVELVFAVGYQTFASKFAKAFQLPPQGFAH